MGALNQLPPELLVGWVMWLVGGLGLMIWFRRRSASPRPRRASGRITTAAAARVVARPVPVRPPARPSDAYTELHALLDGSDDQNRAG